MEYQGRKRTRQNETEEATFWNIMNRLKQFVRPKQAYVNGKKYTVNNGFIYRGINAGGNRVDFRTLYNNEVLEQIVNQL